MDYTEIRNINKTILCVQNIDPSLIDISSTLYYDETGNIKKFVVREDSFNVDADTHFVLGGIEGHIDLEFEDLKQRLKVQQSITKEIKSKHIYKGPFECCLKSAKFETFLDLILEKELHVHFQSLNILYWSVVDILDSIEAAVNSPLIRELKAMLYRVAKYDIQSTANLFYDYGYPDLKTAADLKNFMNGLISLCEQYVKVCPSQQKTLIMFLIHILQEGYKQDKATFIQNEAEKMLINGLTNFYEVEIYKYINCNLIFDNESDIVNVINKRKYVIENKELSNYKFVESNSDVMIQLSDIFVGIMAKYLHAIDVNIDNLTNYINRFDKEQYRRFCKLNKIIKSSIDYNPTFIHQITSIELHTTLIQLVTMYNNFV